MSDLFISLITFALVATISPGGATTLATASGAQFGFVRSIALIVGIAVGLGSLVSIVGGGLGSLILSYPQFQIILRGVGSAYLLWLAWSIARLGAPHSSANAAHAPMGFFKGAFLPLVNPKGWTMALSSAGAYAGLSQNPLTLGLLLGGTFCLAALLALTLWCVGGQWMARALKSERQWRIVNIGLGLLLVASIIPMWR